MEVRKNFLVTLAAFLSGFIILCVFFFLTTYYVPLGFYFLFDIFLFTMIKVILLERNEK